MTQNLHTYLDTQEEVEPFDIPAPQKTIMEFYAPLVAFGFLMGLSFARAWMASPFETIQRVADLSRTDRFQTRRPITPDTLDRVQ